MEKKWARNVREECRKEGTVLKGRESEGMEQSRKEGKNKTKEGKEIKEETKQQPRRVRTE